MNGAIGVNTVSLFYNLKIVTESKRTQRKVSVLSAGYLKRKYSWNFCLHAIPSHKKHREEESNGTFHSDCLSLNRSGLAQPKKPRLAQLQNAVKPKQRTTRSDSDQSIGNQRAKLHFPRLNDSSNLYF